MPCCGLVGLIGSLVYIKYVLLFGVLLVTRHHPAEVHVQAGRGARPRCLPGGSRDSSQKGTKDLMRWLGSGEKS